MKSIAVGFGRRRLIIKWNECVLVLPPTMGGCGLRTEYHAAIIHLCHDKLGTMWSVKEKS